MKKLICIIFCLSAIKSSFSQDRLIFTNLASSPIALGATESASDGSNLYLVNGFSIKEKYTSIVEKYDIKNDKWSILSDKLIPKQFASAEVVGENLYVFNGRKSDGSLNNKLEIVNLKDGSVRLSAANPNAVYNSGSAVWQNNIYVFGGAFKEGSYSKKVFMFDTSREKWIKLKSMPEGMEAQGAFIDGKLYVIGGYNGNPSSRIDVYDVNKKAWKNILKMDKAVSANSIVAQGTKIYSVFDFTDQAYLGVYDIQTSKFSELKQEGMIARRHAGAEIIDGALYIFGGNTSSAQNSCLSSLQKAEIK